MKTNLHKFKHYLKANNYSSKTIENTISGVELFRIWLKKKRKVATRLTYQEALEYISYLQKRNITVATINHYLTYLKHYYNYLAVKRNPLKNNNRHSNTRRTVNYL